MPKPLNTDPTFQTHRNAMITQIQHLSYLSSLPHLPVTEATETLSLIKYRLQAIHDITVAWARQEAAEEAQRQEGGPAHAEP